MKAAEILENLEAWSQADTENRAALMLLEARNENTAIMHHSATEEEMSRLILRFMEEHDDMARAVLVTALFYAKTKMTAKELSEINDCCDAVIAISKANAEKSKKTKDENDD